MKKINEFYVLAEIKPTWIKESNIKINDKDFSKIMDFYVFKAPFSKDLSCQSISLESYGWSNMWNKYYYLKNRIDEGVFSNHKTDFIATQKLEDFYNQCKSKEFNNDFYNNLTKERALILSDKKSKYENLLISIRCAFAHGRVIKKYGKNKEIYYAMENGKNIDGKNYQVKARIVLKKKTLLRWMDILEKGPKIDDSVNQVFKIIRKTGGNIKTNEISKELLLSTSSVKKAIKILKDNKIIEYNKSLRYWNHNFEKYLNYKEKVKNNNI